MIETVRSIFTHGKLLVGIVPRGQGERFIAVAKEAGARGGTILLGRGTAETALLEFLGLGDSAKDVVLVVAACDAVGRIELSLVERGGRRLSGPLLRVDVSHILKHIPKIEAAARDAGPAPLRRPSMDDRHDHVLITLILNRGYADDAMAAARKAGATGGTVINARGTGTEEDVKFFGVALVPEKEVLLIVAEEGKAEAILEAVKATPCLSQPGGGILYCTAVEGFHRLGADKE